MVRAFSDASRVRAHLSLGNESTLHPLQRERIYMGTYISHIRTISYRNIDIPATWASM